MIRRLLIAIGLTLGITTSPQAAQDAGWDVLSGEDAGHPLFVRHLGKLPSWVNKNTYTNLVAITWKLSRAGEPPTGEESAKIYAFEDLLSEAIENSRVGILTTVVTGNGVVEWQYYAVNHDAFMDVLNKTLASQTRYPISISLQSDPNWSAYSRFEKRK